LLILSLNFGCGKLVLPVFFRKKTKNFFARKQVWETLDLLNRLCCVNVSLEKYSHLVKIVAPSASQLLFHEPPFVEFFLAERNDFS
jgi:hypothetical protein